MNCSQYRSYRQRRLGRNKIGKRQGLIEKMGCRENVIDKAEMRRFRGTKGASGQYQFYGCLPAHVARKALRTTERWHDADVDLGLAESGGVCGKGDVSRLDQLATATECKSVDRGDDGFGNDSTRRVIWWPGRMKWITASAGPASR
jgi:hypothetical protein